MELTPEFIINTAQSKQDLSAATIVYLELLLRGYNEALAGVTDTDAITNWIPQVFSGTLSTILVEAVSKSTNGISALFETLISEIMQTAISLALVSQDNTIHPWDIQTAIGNDDNLSTAFQITKEQNTLPVTIILNGTSFDHEVSYEFVMGFLLYTNIHKLDWQITVLEQPIVVNWEPNTLEYQLHRRLESSQFHYKITIDNIQYFFNTPEFMRGFQTGSLWNNDSLIQWSDLTGLDEGKPIALTF